MSAQAKESKKENEKPISEKIKTVIDHCSSCKLNTPLSF